MTTQYTPILQLALPVTGELNGTWGDVVNDNITSMVEEAIAGLATISTWVANSHTLTTADGTTDEARCAMLVATSTTAASEIICPARTKLFVLKNSSSYAVTLKTAAGTGVAVAAGETAFLFCDGTNVNACVTTIVNGHITGNLTVDGNATVNGNTTLGDAVGDTVTINGTTTFTNANPTLSQGTAGRVLFLNGSKVIADAAGLTWDGTTLSATKLAGAFNGTVGATTPSTGVFTQVDITAQGDLRLQDTSGGQYVAFQAPGTVPASYTLTMPDTDGDAGQALITDGSGNLSWSTAASGDVYGPASSTDTAVALFDGNTGKLIKNSGVTIDGSNNVSGVAQLNATTADLTNVEVTNIKAKDGTAAISIADSTGVVTGSTPQVISVNSSTNALRITQTGSGNALLVEDSANPDSTPTVIDGAGRVIVGATATRSVGGSFQTTITNQVFVEQAGIAGIAPATFVYDSNDSNAPRIVIGKSRGTAVGAVTAVQNSDGLGSIIFAGADGTTLDSIAARIDVSVDGTPGTNDMPGRLVFSTTADGASSPTERMRIDNAGRVGIGQSPNNSMILGLTGTPSATFSYAVQNNATFQSTVTSEGAGYITTLKTAAASFTLTQMQHFRAIQGALGAGSTVTNQYGFLADTSLTGATNNYGFYSNIASGTGRWNFYAAGSADNYFAGKVGIGTATPATLFNIASSTAFSPEFRIDNTTNDGNASYIAFAKTRSGAIVQSGDTLGTFQYKGFDGSSLLIAAHIRSEVDGTPGTNDMPGRLVFSTTADGASSPTERMRIDNAGRVGIGGTPGATRSFAILRNITGGISATGTFAAQTVQSDVTSDADIFAAVPSTSATSFTLANLRLYRATQGTIGAGSAVSNQYGFFADSNLTGATNNYGFYSNIASGTGRWNFYAAGSAPNYFAGDVTIVGALTVTDPVVQQSDIGTGPNEVPVNGYLGDLAFQNKEGFVITPAASATPNGIGDMTFELTNNTTLVVKVKGSDGTVRSATLTLA